MPATTVIETNNQLYNQNFHMVPITHTRFTTHKKPPQSTYPKKEVKRILNRSGRKEFLPSRKVNGEVIKLLSFSDCFTAPKKETCLCKSDGK